MEDIRQYTLHDIIDYLHLMSYLKHYKAPHRKINTLLKTGTLIRVKKGLYVLGDSYRDEPICLELLANLIYGPSYISQEYALQYYNLIPERVVTVTSMTCKRNKHFTTPFGIFDYTYLNLKRFRVGVDWQPFRDNIRLLIASPEKAIADTLIQYHDIKTLSDMRTHLIDNMRIETDAINTLNLNRLEKIAQTYCHPIVTLFFNTLKRGL
ncbi:MAG: hypothetical protein A3C55_05785 [Gammaproteobacteria bacterium RIFCSPHIGHO2_02_FULL_42_13]|nr:MAG: hypothetical protein A3C55_05785 [Gammaproteobacteria bacterium RIFCSPHIGHO2_02_FULL_42_13]OGT69425.1 MAG: hypothetical protein A3H43_05425 [Gammaproteobacteria bacterium RIFCSPLOWO2_02_FULL_42_9]